ncbi:hypothetical protein HDU92_008879 [Lobulomyces angularis]|nr:hypothetical protein HDU92_008879 [Lobulomyces angularis]
MPGNKGKYFVASQGEDRIKGMIAMIFADKLINTDERRCKELLGGMAQKLQLEGVSLAELMHNPLLNTGKVVETASAQQSIQIDSTRVKKEEVNTITSFVKLKEETRKVSNLGKLRKNVRGIKALNLFKGMHNKEVKEKVEDPQEEENQEEINEAEENNVEDKEDVTLNIIPFSSVEDHSELEYIPQKKFGSKREEIRKWERTIIK